MVELIGDLCTPSELIVPTVSAAAQPTASGALFMSGAKLYFSIGGVATLITSA